MYISELIKKKKPLAFFLFRGVINLAVSSYAWKSTNFTSTELVFIYWAKEGHIGYSQRLAVFSLHKVYENMRMNAQSLIYAYVQNRPMYKNNLQTLWI